MRIEELLAGLINLAVHMLRTPMYLLLEEKQMLVKVLGSGLLMDSETCQINIAKLNDKKRIRHANIHRIFKNLEVFTLFGDMQINYIKRSKNYEASRWPLYGATSSSSPQADFMVRLPQIREDHVKFTRSVTVMRYSSLPNCDYYSC